MNAHRRDTFARNPCYHSRGVRNRKAMEAELQTGDIVVAIVAALGVIVLIILFVLVFRSTFLKGD